MLTFVALCLLSRIAYSINDVLVGELARRHDQMEIATWRGVSLGLTMAPLLFWVPASAWKSLGARSGELLLLVTITAVANLLQLHAARYLPFGLRAALFVGGIALGGIGLGAWSLDERFSSIELAWCALVLSSAVLSALGNHSSEGLIANVPNAATLKRSILSHHTSAEDAGRVAQAAGVKTLVLSHLVPPDDPAITDDMWLASARTHFHGTVIVGKDLLEI